MDSLTKYSFPQLFLLVATLFTAHSVSAGVYLGASYGQADSYTDEFVENAYGPEFEQSNSYSIYMGYRLNSYVSFEGSFSDLSDYKKIESIPYRSYNPFESRNTETTQKTALDLRSYGIGVRLSTDMTRNYFAAFRLGVHQWESAWEIAVSEIGTAYDIDPQGNTYPPYEVDRSETYDGRDSGQSAFYGGLIGLQLNHWQLGAEYTVRNLGDFDSRMSAIHIARQF